MFSGSLKIAMEHRLSANNFVILDSMNYIKGFRYELYCAARTSSTQHCVVWVGTSDQNSDLWNQNRIERGEDGFSKET